MWEAIRQNQRRSRFLLILMGMLLVMLGVSIGLAVEPQTGGPLGALVAMVVWLVLGLTASLGGDHILLQTAGAQPIEKDDSPRLWNIVEEMTIASGLSKMPAIYIIEEDAPNAFAVGRTPEHAAVAVTSGLLRRLNRDELQGVIAHEIGHIRNLDIRFMTMAAVLVGSITLISDVFFRSLRYGDGRRRSSRSSGNGQAQLVFFLIAVVMAILAPILARLLYFSCSRQREFLADASSARFTRFPDGLASALEKIALRAKSLTSASRAVAPLYIINPLQAYDAAGMFSTHPPTERRIQILRAMAGRAGLVDYEAAYRKVQGEGRSCLGDQTLATETSLTAREPSNEPEEREDAVARSREVGQLLGRIGQFLYIPCTCGLNLKVPPEFPGASVTCPRCGHEHAVPRVQADPVPEHTPETGSAGTPSPTAPAADNLRYQRKQTGWESFRCDCGQTVQLSPAFGSPVIQCPGCKRKIEITAKP